MRLARHLQLGEELSSKQEKLVLCSTVTVRSNERECCFPYHLSQLSVADLKMSATTTKTTDFATEF